MGVLRRPGSHPSAGRGAQGRSCRIEAAAARGYLPIEGIAGYNKGAQALLLGNDSPLAAAGRVLTTQALGGTGALKIGADFLHQLPGSKVLISNPSWENHRALFERAGFEVGTHIVHDAATRGLNFEGMLDRPRRPAKTVVVPRLLPTRPAWIPRSSSGSRSPTSSSRTSWSRSWTSPTRASATACRKTPRLCACSPSRT